MKKYNLIILLFIVASCTHNTSDDVCLNQIIDIKTKLNLLEEENNNLKQLLNQQDSLMKDINSEKEVINQYIKRNTAKPKSQLESGQVQF